MQIATQNATQNPCAAAALAKPVKVFHASRNIQLEFDPSVSPDYAVAYAFCEDNKRLSELFSHRDDGKMPAMYARLPMVHGKRSVACGDWMACVMPTVVNPAGMATPEDIQQMLADVGIKC